MPFNFPVKSLILGNGKVSKTVRWLRAQKSPQHLMDPSDFGCKCNADDQVVGSPGPTLLIIPSRSISLQAASPLTALGEPGMMGRGLARHGLWSCVSISWTTLWAGILVKSTVVISGNWAKMFLYAVGMSLFSGL